MAERSKALDSRHLPCLQCKLSSPRMWAWVQIPLLTLFFFAFFFNSTSDTFFSFFFPIDVKMNVHLSLFRPVYGEETVQEEVINDDTAELSLSKMEEEAQVKF